MTFSSGSWVIAAVSVFVSLLTTMKDPAVAVCLLGQNRTASIACLRTGHAGASMAMTVPVLILVVLSIAIGVMAQPALDREKSRQAR